MSLPVELLEAELLKLPATERARLLDRVVASLDADAERDLAWNALAATRQANLRNGIDVEVDADGVLEELRRELL